MSRNWTEDQKRAINTRGKTLLVSAAAGSGKTATLTERIIQRLTEENEPADISKMLIVTFTRAAAAELRVKIFSALSDAIAQNPSNRHLASQLMKIGSAKICTIDSFYFDLIQANLSALGLSSSPRIADDAQYTLLATEVMEKTIDSFYETREDFAAFTECFTGIKQARFLSDTLLQIHTKLQSLSDGVEFLRKCAESTRESANLDFFACSYGKILQKSSSDVFNHYLPILTEAVDFIQSNPAVDKAYGEQFRIDLKLCSELCEAVKDSSAGYSKAHTLLAQYTHKGLTAIKGGNASERSAMYRDIRARFTSTMDDLKEKAFAKSPETISRAMLDTARYTLILYELLSEFERASAEEKTKLGILTFNDVKRLTLRLLVNPDGTPTDVAKQYAEQFSDIYIDEYQDVDQVQDLIFNSVARANNRFMVGDIKQSIYEFRGADPSLFSQYRAEFPALADSKDSDTACIFMSENFRCDENVIDFTNLVCSKIFSVSPDSIGYTSADNLKFSKEIKNPDYVSSKVTLALVRVPSKKEKDESETLSGLTSHDFEAEYIASEIEKLLKDGKKENGDPIRPGDIAVLFRTKTISPAISAALKRRNILTSEEDAEQYFESPDVLMMLSVLNAIDNPERDIYLAGTLHSPIFGFDMDELLRLRAPYGKGVSLYGALCQYADEHEDDLASKCKDFKSTLEAWQYSAASLPIDRFLLMLFDSEKFISSGIVAQPNDDGEGGNLLLLYEYARGFESGSFKGLYQFIEYVNSIIEKGQTLSLGEASRSPEQVSLMTIHKSKGLEFPVCFVCGTSGSIRSKDTKESFVFDKKCGVAMKVSDETGMARINTPMREAILSSIATRQAEEEMRILYVALTRAREKLYVTAATSKDPFALLEEAKADVEFFDRYTVINECSSYLDWILLACENTENPTYQFVFPNGIELFEGKNDEHGEEISVKRKEIKHSENKELTEKLRNKFDFSYQYAGLARVPSKISVSRLYPDVLDETQDGVELFAQPRKFTVPEIFSGITSKPSSAERGTATHLFLQFCDFEYAHEHGVEHELSRLIYKRFIPDSAKELIYTDELERFLQSELIDRILCAERVIREQRFNVKLSPTDFSKNERLLQEMQNEQLAVQGVIDLILVNKDGDIELFDYKTDRLSAAALENDELARQKMQSEHGLQLSYYAQACRLLFGKPCARVAVYSTHSAKLYDIDVSNARANAELF